MAAPRKTRSKVGVIGLGIIGTRVAANLRSAGHQVYVWSRTPRAAPNFLGSVVEVVDLCEVILLFVSDDQALNDVVRTMGSALSRKHTVLCHATVSPAATRKAAAVVEGQGARYLDAPFTGSKLAAQNRQLVFYVGGAAPVLAEVRPVLEATAKAVLHVGGIGDAAVLKIATNMLTASIVQSLAEGLALVRSAGIDPTKFAEALENNGSRSGTSDLKLPAMIAGNAETSFSLKHMFKDVSFAQELADQYELSLPLADTAAEVMSLGIQNGWGDQDFSVVSQLYSSSPEAEKLPVPPVPKEVPVPTAKPLEVEKTEKKEIAPAIGARPVPPPAEPAPPPKELPVDSKPSEKTLAETVQIDPPDKADSPKLVPLLKPIDALKIEAVLPAPPKAQPPDAANPEPALLPVSSSALPERKSTFRFIREFFKPVASDSR